jgi:dolichol-phosphate mannosyltransferase
MLLDAKKHGIEIRQIPIKTIYLEKNKKSHFNPLLDSISIYKVLLKFLWASLFSTFIDFAVFAFLIFLLKDVQKSLQIFAATAIARAVSSFLNFLANKNLVFKSKNGLRVSAAKYYTLCIVQMLCSYGGVYALTLLLGFKPLILKIMVDFMLFLISFQIQREWVFKNGKKH